MELNKVEENIKTNTQTTEGKEKDLASEELVQHVALGI